MYSYCPALAGYDQALSARRAKLMSHIRSRGAMVPHRVWPSLHPSPSMHLKRPEHSFQQGCGCATQHWRSDADAEDIERLHVGVGLPAARGIVAVATEVVCRITFSPMLKPEVIPYRSSTRKTPNPSTADCSIGQPILRMLPVKPRWHVRHVTLQSSMLCKKCFMTPSSGITRAALTLKSASILHRTWHRLGGSGVQWEMSFPPADFPW